MNLGILLLVQAFSMPDLPPIPELPPSPLMPIGLQIDMPAPGDTMLAFPGAVGWGAHALDICRDSVAAGAWQMKVWRITSTVNSADPGTAAWAFAQTSNTVYDIVIPTIGMRVGVPAGELILNRNCVYWAGQAGQGSGFSMGGRLRVNAQNKVPTTDWVVRGITFRRGSIGPTTGGRRWIFDHNSISWYASSSGTCNFHVAGDTTTASQTSSESENYEWTVSHVMSGEPHFTHPTHFCIGGLPRAAPPIWDGVLFKNVIGNSGHRTPSQSGDRITLLNNVWWNWRSRASEVATDFRVQYINNLSRLGPGSPTLGTVNSFPIMNRSGCSVDPPGHPTLECTKRLMVVGHKSDVDNFLGTSDPWSGSLQQAVCKGPLTGSWSGGTFDTDGQENACPNVINIIPVPWRRADTLVMAAFTAGIPALITMTEALASAIVDSAGASWGVQCDGTRSFTPSAILRRDVVDQRYHDGYENGTGNVEAVDKDTFPSVPVTPGVACPDDDGDGMPNEWEMKCSDGASPISTLIDGDENGDGYFNMEAWINGVQGKILDWTDTSNDEDGFRIYRQTFPQVGFNLIATLAIDVQTFTDLAGKPRDRYKVASFFTGGGEGLTAEVLAKC